MIRRGERALSKCGADASKTPLVPLAPKSDLNWNTSRPTDARGPVGRRSDLRRRQYRWRVRMNIRRSAMSDAALSERRAAALERSAHSNAMKPAASKTGRDRRADVWSSYPAAGMEGPYAGKTWGDRSADVDSCGPAKPVQTTAPSKTWRHWRADMGNSDASAMETSGPTKAMKPAARRADVWSSYPAAGMEGPYAGKTRGDRRADVGSSGAVKLMKIAAAKAAAGKTRGDGRGAGVETGRRMNAAGAKATKTRATAKGRNAAGAQTDGRRSAAGA